MERKNFFSPLAHDMLFNHFNDLRAEDRVVVIDSKRGEMQSQMSSLGMSPQSAVKSIRTATTPGVSSELITVATRERGVAKQGE
jgi:hypothetical protein